MRIRRLEESAVCVEGGEDASLPKADDVTA